MMALKALGYSMNTENQAELNEAYDWLVTCVENYGYRDCHGMRLSTIWRRGERRLA